MDTHDSHKFLEVLPDFQTVLALKKALKKLCNSWPKRFYIFGKKDKELISPFSLTCSGAIHGGV